MLHHLPVGGLLGQQLPSSALHDALHGAEAGADPRGQVEVLPLRGHMTRHMTQRQPVSDGHTKKINHQRSKQRHDEAQTNLQPNKIYIRLSNVWPAGQIRTLDGVFSGPQNDF